MLSCIHSASRCVRFCSRASSSAWSDIRGLGSALVATHDMIRYTDVSAARGRGGCHCTFESEVASPAGKRAWHRHGIGTHREFEPGLRKRCTLVPTRRGCGMSRGKASRSDAKYHVEFGSGIIWDFRFVARRLVVMQSTSAHAHSARIWAAHNLDAHSTWRTKQSRALHGAGRFSGLPGSNLSLGHCE